MSRMVLYQTKSIYDLNELAPPTALHELAVLALLSGARAVGDRQIENPVQLLVDGRIGPGNFSPIR
jgi:hypothetical protein